MRAWNNLVLMTVLLLLSACGSEPTAVHAPTEARRNTGTLTVVVSGPTQVADFECAMWHSTVSGGTAPYEYSWSGLTTTDYTQSSVWGSVSSGYASLGYVVFASVAVEVTDALGKKAYDWIEVYVPPYSSSGPGSLSC